MGPGKLGTLAGGRDCHPRPEGWPLQNTGTCPSQDDKDLVGLLHSLATTLRSFCKMHISRLCPSQAGETRHAARLASVMGQGCLGRESVGPTPACAQESKTRHTGPGVDGGSMEGPGRLSLQTRERVQEGGAESH